MAAPPSYRARAMTDTINAAATIIPLDNVDPALVEQLLDTAFGKDRSGRTAYKVREGMDWLPGLSFAALDAAEMLVGTIQCWPVALNAPEGRPFPMIMVGPVAVMPQHQGMGYGQALMSTALSGIDDRAPLPQVMIGDPEYYGRFWGFSNDATGEWELPGPFEKHRLLVRSDNPAVLPRHGMLGPWIARAG